MLIAFSARYGYHRDELYFLAAARHLAWGYPDQPPLVPLMARLMSDLAPASLVVLRLPSAVASAALVLLTGLLARELGGGRAAQILAATSIAVAPLATGAGHLLSTTTFDLPAWALVCWLVVRMLRTGDDRLWLAAGLAAGAALLDSDLIAFLLLAVVIGLAVSGPRRPFGSAWLYAGGVIAIAMWAPYLAWQAGHGWPELAIARSIANGGSGAYVREIAAAYNSLPPSQRGPAIVLANNYGEAGAVDHFGRADGLPAAYSGHNGFWYWGPPPASAVTAVAVGFDRQALAPICGILRLAARLSNHLGVHDDEQGAQVWVCSALRASWAAIWPRLRNFG